MVDDKVARARGHAAVPNDETEAAVVALSAASAEGMVKFLIGGYSDGRDHDQLVAEIARHLEKAMAARPEDAARSLGLDVDALARVRWELVATHLVSRQALRNTIAEALDSLMERAPKSVIARREAGPRVAIAIEPTDHGFNVVGNVNNERVCLVCAAALSSERASASMTVLSSPSDIDSDEAPVVVFELCEKCQSFASAGLPSSRGSVS